MSRDDIWAVLFRNVLAVLTDLEEGDVRPEASLRDLGANSLDRVDIAVGAMDELRMNIPTQELVGVSNLGQLADVLYAHGERP